MPELLTRRDWLASVSGATVVALLARPAFAALATRTATHAAPNITIYKSPTCGCCAKWVDHMRAAGFATTVHDTEGMDAIKAKHGVPAALQSCHTALAGAYVIEGHVPAADVLKLLRDKPAVRGVAAPGMPAGSPGMEMGGAADRFDVIAFARDGKTSVFARH
jgi:hypothetical protein